MLNLMSLLILQTNSNAEHQWSELYSCTGVHCSDQSKVEVRILRAKDVGAQKQGQFIWGVGSV